MNYQSKTNQKILGEFVAQDIIMNATMLVDDLLACGRLDYEDIQNYYYYLCPECGGEMEEVLDERQHSTDYSCKDCSHEQHREPEQEIRGVYEWWFVTEWLFEKLQSLGQPVIDSPYGFLWGRCTTGQAILLDYVIGKIAEELELLEGQENDWSKQ